MADNPIVSPWSAFCDFTREGTVPDSDLHGAFLSCPKAKFVTARSVTTNPIYLTNDSNTTRMDAAVTTFGGSSVQDNNQTAAAHPKQTSSGIDRSRFATVDAAISIDVAEKAQGAVHDLPCGARTLLLSTCPSENSDVDHVDDDDDDEDGDGGHEEEEKKTTNATVATTGGEQQHDEQQHLLLRGIDKFPADTDLGPQWHSSFSSLVLEDSGNESSASSGNRDRQEATERCGRWVLQRKMAGFIVHLTSIDGTTLLVMSKHALAGPHVARAKEIWTASVSADESIEIAKELHRRNLVLSAECVSTSFDPSHPVLDAPLSLAETAVSRDNVDHDEHAQVIRSPHLISSDSNETNNSEFDEALHFFSLHHNVASSRARPFEELQSFCRRHGLRSVPGAYIDPRVVPGVVTWLTWCFGDGPLDLSNLQKAARNSSSPSTASNACGTCHNDEDPTSSWSAEYRQEVLDTVGAAQLLPVGEGAVLCLERPAHVNVPAVAASNEKSAVELASSVRPLRVKLKSTLYIAARALRSVAQSRSFASSVGLTADSAMFIPAVCSAWARHAYDGHGLQTPRSTTNNTAVQVPQVPAEVQKPRTPQPAFLQEQQRIAAVEATKETLMSAPSTAVLHFLSLVGRGASSELPVSTCDRSHIVRAIPGEELVSAPTLASTASSTIALAVLRDAASRIHTVRHREKLAVVFGGPPGAGKSTAVRRLKEQFEAQGRRVVIVSRDECTAAIERRAAAAAENEGSVDFRLAHSARLQRQAVHRTFSSAIRSSVEDNVDTDVVLVDACFASPASRQAVVSLLTSSNPKGVRVAMCWISTPDRAFLLKRIVSRTDHILSAGDAQTALYNVVKVMKEPTPTEASTLNATLIAADAKAIGEHPAEFDAMLQGIIAVAPPSKNNVGSELFKCHAAVPVDDGPESRGGKSAVVDIGPLSKLPLPQTAAQWQAAFHPKVARGFQVAPAIRRSDNISSLVRTSNNDADTKCCITTVAPDNANSRGIGLKSWVDCLSRAMKDVSQSLLLHCTSPPSAATIQQSCVVAGQTDWLCRRFLAKHKEDSRQATAAAGPTTVSVVDVSSGDAADKAATSTAAATTTAAATALSQHLIGHYNASEIAADLHVTLSRDLTTEDPPAPFDVEVTLTSVLIDTRAVCFRVSAITPVSQSTDRIQAGDQTEAFDSGENDAAEVHTKEDEDGEVDAEVDAEVNEEDDESTTASSEVTELKQVLDAVTDAGQFLHVTFGCARRTPRAYCAGMSSSFTQWAAENAEAEMMKRSRKGAQPSHAPSKSTHGHLHDGGTSAMSTSAGTSAATSKRSRSEEAADEQGEGARMEVSARQCKLRNFVEVALSHPLVLRGSVVAV